MEVVHTFFSVLGPMPSILTAFEASKSARIIVGGIHVCFLVELNILATQFSAALFFYWKGV